MQVPSFGVHINISFIVVILLNPIIVALQPNLPWIFGYPMRRVSSKVTSVIIAWAPCFIPTSCPLAIKSVQCVRVQ